MNDAKQTLTAPANDETRAAATFSGTDINAKKAVPKNAVVTQVTTTEDYPWGSRLRCTRTMWVEVDKTKTVTRGKDKGKLKIGKGMRVVTQTIDPRDGRTCAPKRGTYTEGLIVLHVDAETGHTTHKHIAFRGYDGVTQAVEFLALHPEVADLAPEYHTSAWLALELGIVTNARYTAWREGADVKAALSLPRRHPRRPSRWGADHGLDHHRMGSRRP